MENKPLKTTIIMRKYSPIELLWIPLILAFFVLTGCTKEPPPDDTGSEPMSVASCEGCHINYAHLQAVYTPDTAAPAGGCGGTAPHYEPYDRVYMGGEGYAKYKTSPHYQIGCTGCHNGVDNTDDKTVAHSGDFIRHPSVFSEEKCGACHKEIVDNFMTSLHHGTGQMRKVALRSGLSGADEFYLLPEHQKEGYNANCATCHGSCGECHIIRPTMGGGGLSNGHAFNKTPDMISVCVTCHVSRGGHAYLGVASGTQPDAHLTEAGYKCIDCHKTSDLHGNGEPVDQRYAYANLPTCGDCHKNIGGFNIYHSTHLNDFNCQVCHSQVYNNCGSCHIHGDGARIPSYMDFKIARNPIPEIKTGFDFTLVRRTLAAPDNWSVYGVPNYPDFAVLPTYNYTSPHNILTWTDRTLVPEGKSCYYNCHIRNEDGVLVNKEYYLFKEDLLAWEVDATEKITVDGKLPESWFR